MARSISSSGTDPKTTVSEADPYAVMINAIRVRIEHNPHYGGRNLTALQVEAREGYREACFDILEELSLIRSKAVKPDA